MATSDTSARARGIGTWQSRLRRGIGLTLVLKAVALLVLWLLFFSPAHRVAVTPSAVDALLSLGTAAEPAPPSAAGSSDD